MDDLTFSKIVATPTLNSWSQAYNAGKLFAVLSLEKTHEPTVEETESLNMLGKDLLERLEQEFFAIENKNLESIKKAVSAVFDQKIEDVNVSFVTGAIIGNILYLFGLGKSKVFIKRSGNLGLALDSENTNAKNISSSSGFLKEGDLVVLATEAFCETITQDDLDFNLTDTEPTEITETLAPKIHKAENGKISAIIIKYRNLQTKTLPDEEIIIEPEEATQEELPDIQQNNQISMESAEKQTSPIYRYLSSFKSKLKRPNVRFHSTKKIFLTIIVAIVAILIISVSLAIREQNNAKIKALFEQIYPQATKKYDEGQSLIDLNKTYARDSFLAAQKILNENKDNFPPQSTQAIQTQDLLKKITDELALVSPIDKSGLDRSKLSVVVENGSGVEGTAAKGATVLKDLGYNVVSTGNADNYNYQGVTIKVKSVDSNFLDLLKKDLAKDYTIKSSSSDLPSSDPSDCVIIIGK